MGSAAGTFRSVHQTPTKEGIYVCVERRQAEGDLGKLGGWFQVLQFNQLQTEHWTSCS